MSRFRSFAFFLAALLFVTPGWSQTSTRQIDLNPASVGSPIAFVYVTRPTHIDGFAVSSSGKLTPVPGSPFANIAASSLSVNKKFLFAAGDNNKDIYTFAIASDGAIKRVSEIDVQKYSDGCGTIGPLQIDNTGSTVYLQVNDGCQDNLFIQSFRIESNGDLRFGDATRGRPRPLSVPVAGRRIFSPSASSARESIASDHSGPSSGSTQALADFLGFTLMAAPHRYDVSGLIARRPNYHLWRRPKTTESRGVIWRGTSAAGIPFRVGRH